MAGEERTLEPDGDFDLMVAKLMRDLGVKDAMFAGQLISQAASFPALKGSDSATASNFVTAAIQEIGPRDGVEAMLAMQMVATHNAAMEHLRRLAIDQNHIAVSDSIANRATKLLRTFTSQVEALNRYRNAGKQVITVNHIGQQVNANEAITVGCLPGGLGVSSKMERCLMSAKEINGLTIGQKMICGAKGKRNGKPCPRPPMTNGRCYHHGGASPGALPGAANANYKHGRYTREAKAERRQMRELIRNARSQLKIMKEMRIERA